MKIYVAARFFEKEKVREIYSQLEKMGHTIIADWTKHKNSKPYDKNPDICREYSIEDFNGVKNCDVFIFLTSKETGSGSSVELGSAIALYETGRKPKIYIVGKDLGYNVFYFHPSVNIKKNMSEVYKELK